MQPTNEAAPTAAETWVAEVERQLAVLWSWMPGSPPEPGPGEDPKRRRDRKPMAERSTRRTPAVTMPRSYPDGPVLVHKGLVLAKALVAMKSTGRSAKIDREGGKPLVNQNGGAQDANRDRSHALRRTD